MKTQGIPSKYTARDKCAYCGVKVNIDFILGIEKFLCAECFAALHKAEMAASAKAKANNY